MNQIFNESPSFKSITEVLQLINSYKEYNFDITSYVKYKNFWEWKKHDLIEESNVLDGSVSVPGKDKIPTRMNLHGYFWLRIVASLKDFGMKSVNVKKVKETTHAKIDVADLLKDTPIEELAELLKESNQLPVEDKNQIAEYILSGEFVKDIESTKVDYLFAMIYRLIYLRHDIRLVVQPDYKAFFHDPMVSTVPFEKIIENKQVIVLHLRQYLIELMSDYRHVPFLTRYGSLNEDEAKILDVVRDEEVKYVKIKFKRGKPDKLMVDKETKIDANQKLSNYLLKGGFEDILIKTSEGNVNYSVKTESIKLSNKDT